ncbi:MAG: hypothetical protein GYA23_09815 [Methanomicrobiales archaeon]|nr:hypothetical protein [Methanomicrobiales archaeon]
MEACAMHPEKRTWIFFFLILLVALLWATFLLIRGEMVAVSTTLAVVAAFISFFSFTCCTKYRTWIFFYLIVLTAVLWATFLLLQGAMVWVSALLFIVAGGTTIFSFLFCETEHDTL